MTSPSGASYARLSKLVSVIGSRGPKLKFLIRLEGSERMSGENKLKRPAVERKGEKMAWSEVCRRIRRNSENRFHIVVLFAIGGLSGSIWASPTATTTTARPRSPSTQSSQ